MIQSLFLAIAKSDVDEINISLSHDLNPVLFRAGKGATPYPVTTDGGDVYCFGDNLSDEDLSEAASLYTWKASRYYSHKFNYLAFSAEFEAMEYNIFDWFPKAAVEHFFAESTCHYYFAYEFEGLDEKSGKPTGLTNRVNLTLRHAVVRSDDSFSLTPISETEPENKMALDVKTARFTIQNVDFATHQDTAVIFAASFYVPKKRMRIKQMLVQTMGCKDQGVYISGDKCYWLGSKDHNGVGLDILTAEWNFVILLLDQRGTGLIQVNETLQSFEMKPVYT